MSASGPRQENRHAGKKPSQNGAGQTRSTNMSFVQSQLQAVCAAKLEQLPQSVLQCFFPLARLSHYRLNAVMVQ